MTRYIAILTLALLPPAAVNAEDHDTVNWNINGWHIESFRGPAVDPDLFDPDVSIVDSGGSTDLYLPEDLDTVNPDTAFEFEHHANVDPIWDGYYMSFESGYHAAVEVLLDFGFSLEEADGILIDALDVAIEDAGGGTDLDLPEEFGIVIVIIARESGPDAASRMLQDLGFSPVVADDMVLEAAIAIYGVERYLES